MGRSHPDLTYLFFLILKYISFKKLNRMMWDGLEEMRKFSNPSPFIIDFCFYFFIFYILFYYIKINIFIKNKSIMIFYKLFIKNIIIIIIIIYIKV